MSDTTEQFEGSCCAVLSVLWLPANRKQYTGAIARVVEAILALQFLSSYCLTAMLIRLPKAR